MLGKASYPRRLRTTALAIVCALLSTACAFALRSRATIADLAMIHLLGVVLVSLRFSVWDSLAACVVSILAFAYVFLPPTFAFAWTDAESSLIFVAMLVVAGVISGLTERLRHQEMVARAAAFRAEALYGLNVELSSVVDARQLAAVTRRHLERLFSARVMVLLRRSDGSFDGHAPEDERALAERAWVRREFTRTQREDRSSIWVPIEGVRGPLGVLGLSGAEAFDMESDQGFLLSACANQFATAAERIRFANAVHKTELEAETERLRNSLLSAVSHDLKTPLASMIAAGTTLIARKAELDAATADTLLSTIVSEGERLRRLIQNLLSISRLEAPTIELRRTPEGVEDIVSVAVGHFTTRLGSATVVVDLADDLPLVSVEPLLVEQVLANLLENAARYAGASSTIRVDATAGRGFVTIRVVDEGPGIPEDERDKVFEKFYRGRGAGKSDGGAGLGLTICRAIVRAHGGRIVVREAPSGGTVVEFTLPIAEPRLMTGEEPRAGDEAAQ